MEEWEEVGGRWGMGDVVVTRWVRWKVGGEWQGGGRGGKRERFRFGQSTFVRRLHCHTNGSV